MVGTRRGLLAAGAGLALAGCGSNDRGEQKPSPTTTVDQATQGDIALLNQLLELEFAAAGEHKGDHLTRLSEAVMGLGGTPAARGAVDSGRLETIVAAYVDAIPKITEPDLRGLVASILTVHAEQLVADGAKPAAFVTGTP